jgi:hypothetical protein
MPPTFWVPMAMEGWKVGVGGGGGGGVEGRWWGGGVGWGWVVEHSWASWGHVVVLALFGQ